MLPLAQCLTSYYDYNTPTTAPLFQAHVSRLAICIRRTGHTFNNDSDIEQQVWSIMKVRQFAQKNGRRCNMNRFQGSLHTCASRLQYWEIDEFERLVLALEEGLIQNRQLIKRLSLTVGKAAIVAEGGGTTSGSLVKIEDKTVQSCCQNAILVSLLFLSDFTNHRLCSMVVAAGRPVLDWHTEQNRELRSCDGIERWFLAQLTEGKCWPRSLT